MPFPYDDYRVFLDELEQEGMLVKVKKEVDWNLEAGAIARRIAEVGKGRAIHDGGTPAVLFEKIKGYPEGFRMSSKPIAGIDRCSKAFGYDYKGQDTSSVIEGVMDVILEGLHHPIKPIVIDAKKAPCKQNKMLGSDINLYKFPAPMLHDGDGGRYLSTWHAVITKDPESDWVNWGTYRSMIIDRTHLAGLILRGQHIGKIYYKYESANQPMPFAIAISPDPVSFSMSASGIPQGVNEVDVVGGIRKKPVPLVKCETNDLLVPAFSEIVIEGVVLPGKRVWEGPYGEYTGYRASPRDQRPIYEVHAVTYRDDPILTFESTGTPVTDWGANFSTSAMAREALAQAGIRARVWMPAEISACLMVVAVKDPIPNIATMVKNVLTSQLGTVCMYTYKYLVVNDDIDIYDSTQVLWAICSRVHPRRGIIVSDEMCGPLAPYASLEERLKMNAPHLTFDATWPLDWHPTIAVPPVASFKSIYPQEIQDKVLLNWKEYGL